MAAKKLQGMPTIQSAVGILLGTFAVIGKQRLRKNRVNRKHLHNFVIRLLSCSFIIHHAVSQYFTGILAATYQYC